MSGNIGGVQTVLQLDNKFGYKLNILRSFPAHMAQALLWLVYTIVCQFIGARLNMLF